MPFITIDPYYDNQFFNECKEALKNNEVPFDIFISIKTPFNWYFKLPDVPSIINYDKATKEQERWLINTVEPLRPNEEYLLLRRNNDNGPKALLKFVENEPLRLARKSDFGVFFTVRNKEELETISKEYPGIIWYMGKYYSNKFRVCLCTHPAIKLLIDESQILLEKGTDLSEPGRFEAELNWKIFRGKDALVKFTETPYFKGGKMTKVKIAGEHSGRFII